MAIRGTKKTVEALEELFETGNKPNQQAFFDWMASFYHKDEDISFLISIAKATLTDAQTGSDNQRFMTALRVYQSILWWVRLEKLPLLNLDIVELVNDRINQLFAVDDEDSLVDTLGEVLQAFQGYSENVSTILSISNKMDVVERKLHQVPDNLRQVQNTFDSLSSLVTNAQNSANNAQSKADDAWNRANNAQAKANDAWDKAVDAWNRANNAQASANNAQAKADDGWNRANNAQDTANNAYNRTDDIYNKLGNVSGYNVHNQLNGILSYAQSSAAYLQDRIYNLETFVGAPHG